MKKILLTLAALSLSISARAQSEALASSAGSFEASAAAMIAPFVPQDVFAGVGACGVLDIKTIRAWTLEEASDLAKPCLEAVGSKYQETLTMQAGLIADATLGKPAAPGLLLKSDVVRGSKAHRDLLDSLAHYQGRLLGQPVRLLARGETAPASVSAVQSALGQCMLTTVVRDLRNGADFKKIYGNCLLRNPDLGIQEINAGSDLTVRLKAAQTPAAVESLNGLVTVNAGTGPVQFIIVAVGVPAQAQSAIAQR
jgi:hypothetical protein